MTLFLTCSPACQTTRKPQQADNPFLRDSSYLLRHQTGNSLLFNNFVHHFQSPIKICGQMPFLGLLPGLFIPHRSWRPTVPLLLPAWDRKSALPNCCWHSFSQQGQQSWAGVGGGGSDRAEPVAFWLIKKSPRSQAQLLTWMTVNNEELQKQIPQASSYSDYDGVWCQGPCITYAWVRKPEAWRFNGDWQEWRSSPKTLE